MRSVAGKIAGGGGRHFCDKTSPMVRSVSQTPFAGYAKGVARFRCCAAGREGDARIAIMKVFLPEGTAQRLKRFAPSPRFSVAWEVSPDDANALRFVWEERDGPLVSPPDRDGFGMTFLRRALPLQVNGNVGIQFLDGGARVVIEARLPPHALAST